MKRFERKYDNIMPSKSHINIYKNLDLILGDTSTIDMDFLESMNNYQIGGSKSKNKSFFNVSKSAL